MNLFINNQNVILVGKPLEEARELSQEEESLYYRGYGYEIINGTIQDISTSDEYIAAQERLEQERIQALTISKTNLFKAIYLSKGFTPQYIRGRIELIADEQQRVLALIDFDNAKDFYRKHPLFGDFALSLGFSKEDIDAIFMNGATHG